MTQYIFRRITDNNRNWKIGLRRILNPQLFHCFKMFILKKAKILAFYIPRGTE